MICGKLARPPWNVSKLKGLLATPKQLQLHGKALASNQPIAYKLSSGREEKHDSLGLPPTYNELPLPHGSWEQDYKKNNDKYNRHLMMGVGMLMVTLFTVSQVVDFNFYPPPLPEQDDMCEMIKPKCV